MSEEYKYQKALDYANENGSKAHKGMREYKLLFKLAQIQGVDMNGGQNNIMKEFSYSKNKIKKLTQDALDIFCSTGKLVVPREFLFRKRKQYRHDGDAKANRNLWNESNKENEYNSKKELPTYVYNTVKN